jgi:hypothetical protein
LIIFAAVVASRIFKFDKSATALLILVFGYATHAFAGLIAIIGTIPVVGTYLVTILTLPFFLLVNGLAYLVTLIALRKGDAKAVMNSRILVSALLVGIIIGYFLGKLF